MGRELLERFRVLASLPLAGTAQRERRVDGVAIPQIKSHLFMVNFHWAHPLVAIGTGLPLVVGYLSAISFGEVGRR